MTSFMKNPDNFICKDKLRNTSINASAHLAEKFGYTKQELGLIKLLAEWQFDGDIALNNPDDGVSVYYEDIGLICPWMDETGRFELTDVGAVNCYGEECLREWCAKAHDALKDEQKLAGLHIWAEMSTYVKKYPYRTPTEKYELEW